MNIQYVIFGFFLLFFDSGDGQYADESVFKIGFVLEHSDIDSVELENALEILRSQIGSSFDFVLKTYLRRDSFTILQQTCRAIREGAAFIIAQASCASIEVIQTLTNTLEIPTLFIPKFSFCTKIPNQSSTAFPMRVNNSLVYNRLGSILTKNDWNNYLIMYDDYFAESYISELEQVLKESIAETSKDQVDGRAIKIYDPEGTGDMQSTLIRLNTNGLFTNFIVLASQKNTLRLLKQAKNLGLFGLNYKWVLANIDLDITQFQHLSPQFNALMIIRQLPLSAFDKKLGFVDPKWSGFYYTGISRNMSYLLNAAQLAIEALNITYKNAKAKTNYDQVKNLNCLKDNKFKDGSKIIDRIKLKKRLKDGSYDYFGIGNEYLGISYFNQSEFESGEVLPNPVAEESRFEVYPHLEMLRYDMRGDDYLAGIY